jgi:uncharacterized protein YbjT (DUF2867 family)
MNKILVVGASGRVGRLLLRNLIAAGESVRASSRNPETANFSADVESVAADITKPETMIAALNGVTKVFLYANPEGIQGFVKEAKDAGVKHIVLLSSSAILSRNEDDFVVKRHLTVERAIIQSGIAYTFLRPGAFASNALLWRHQIINESKVSFPYPLAQSAPIHESDIAAVATKALTSSGYEGATPFLTGPESITQLRQVELIGDAIGRIIPFEELAPDKAPAIMSKYMPLPFVQILIKAFQSNNGAKAVLSDDVEKITGRPAIKFAEWAKEHKKSFL